MSKLEKSCEESIDYFYKNMLKFKDSFSYIANNYNSIAINFLAESIIDRLDDKERINELETELMHQFFISIHKEYINKLAFGIVYRSKLLKPKEDLK